MPLDLPGTPLKPPGSNKTIKCPRCNRIHSGPTVVEALKLRMTKNIVVTCKNCGYKIYLKKAPRYPTR